MGTHLNLPRRGDSSEYPHHVFLCRKLSLNRPAPENANFGTFAILKFQSSITGLENPEDLNKVSKWVWAI